MLLGTGCCQCAYSPFTLQMGCCGAGQGRAAATDKAAPASQLAPPPPPPALGVSSQKWRVRLLRAEMVDDVFTGKACVCTLETPRAHSAASNRRNHALACIKQGTG